MPRPGRTTESSRRSRRASAVQRVLGLLGVDRRDITQSLIALGLLALTATIAGIALGRNARTLEEFPGLLLMVPAAIALRGNIFGALGSRLGTAVHTGTFRFTLRPQSVVGQNVLASAVLTLSVSVALAVLARGAAVVFGLGDSISLGDFIVISVVGGVLASALVLVAALVLAEGSVRRGWDPDNVTAPLVTAMGDLATVPALIFAARLLGGREFIGLGSIGLSVVAVGGLAIVLLRGRGDLRRIIVESIPVLLLAVLLDLVAGVVIERRLDRFAELPTLLVVLPAYLAAAGALGGILSSRLSSKLHLGVLTAARFPSRAARPDIGATFAMGLPVFALCGALAAALGGWFGLAGPSTALLIGAAVVGGLAAAALAVVVAYYGTIAAVRFGLDPDTWGIPLVTSALDLVGAFTFILAVNLLGIL